MDWMIPKKTYLCPWNRGCLPDYVLQSTPVSNKTQNLDKSQPFSVIISIIESTKIRKIHTFRKQNADLCVSFRSSSFSSAVHARCTAFSKSKLSQKKQSKSTTESFSWTQSARTASDRTARNMPHPRFCPQTAVSIPEPALTQPSDKPGRSAHSETG